MKKTRILDVLPDEHLLDVEAERRRETHRLAATIDEKLGSLIHGDALTLVVDTKAKVV